MGPSALFYYKMGLLGRWGRDLLCRGFISAGGEKEPVISAARRSWSDAVGQGSFSAKVGAKAKAEFARSPGELCQVGQGRTERGDALTLAARRRLPINRPLMVTTCLV